ncbi:MAG TPA: nitroreductase family protein [Bacillota bacterium]|nr:nitroreductase family protein [Bacillota bacterium]
MMETYAAINSRRTVRDFAERPIEPATLKMILNAGLQAPSNNHLREWEFIVVDQMSMRIRLIDKVPKSFTQEEVADWLDSWGAADACQRAMYFNGVPKQYRMLLTAGALVIPCFRQWKPLTEINELFELNGFASIWCCIENILLAAASEGIFGVTRIPFAGESEYIKEVLKIPTDYEVPCYIALGYPQNANPIEQIPIQIEDKLHFNRW